MMVRQACRSESGSVARRLGAALLALTVFLLLRPPVARADDPDGKSGVAPQVISLPSGPGSIEGLGASFEPDLSTGTASYPVAFSVAPGVAGFQPDLALLYNGGNANGPWGMGWKLNLPYVQRRTDAGLPSYVDDQDQFVYSDGEKLVALDDGDYRFENEGGFMRFRRLPGEGWEAHSPDGTRYLFGETAGAREFNAYGIFCWKLERQIDVHGNEIHYFYLNDSGYSYIKEIRYNWSVDGRYNAVIFSYAPRSDVFTDRRSRAPISLGLRGTDLQVWAQGKLVRAYRFDYGTETSTGAHSLLERVTVIGDDGVSALPPHTFTYTQFDPTAYAVVSMSAPPPLGLANPDADLVDVNADSLPDLVYTPSEGHRFYLNRGAGRWQPEPVYPAQSPPDRLSSPGARMADMDGNGQVDLLVKAGSTPGSPFYYYAGAAGEQWEQGDRIDYNLTPSFALDDPNLRLVDANHDKRIDVILTTPSTSYIWLAHADDTWSETADAIFPTLSVGTPLVFEDPHVKLGDMTGDRLQDMVYLRDGLVAYFPHNGLGDYGDGVMMVNPPQGIGDLDIEIQLGDLNNDGLDDLVLVGNGQVTYWLNRGDRSFVGPVTLNGTPAYNAADTAIRLADIDGDGATELLYNRYPAPEAEVMQYLDFDTGTQPFLLASIDNGLGRTTHVAHRPATDFYVADWDAGLDWETRLPFPVQVVSRVTIHDANSGDDYVTAFSYRDGYYDGDQKEFRGFARAEQVAYGDATAPTTRTQFVYDTGASDESRKGLLLEQTVLGAGGQCQDSFAGCYQRQVNRIATRRLYDEGPEQVVAYSYVTETTTFIHEQQAQPVQLRQTFEQDSYGNLIRDFNYGQVCDGDVACGDDEVLKHTEYAYNLEAWILNRPARVYQTDAEGNFVSEARFYYDGQAYVGLALGQVTRGNLSRQEASLGPLGAGRFIPTRRQAFDDYGNTVGIQDANGNLTQVTYDALSHTFPVVERLHLGNGQTLSYAAAYHPGFGQVTAATDYNGQPSIFTYDTFGRLSKVALPGDSLAQPTQQFSYTLGSPRSSITTAQRERSRTDDVLLSVAYFDGLGRPLQTRREAEDGQVVVETASSFNARQGVRDQFLAYFDASLDYAAPNPALPRTTQHYDPLARAVRTVNPDGTFTIIAYQPLVQVQADEEDNRPASPHAGTPRFLAFDGLERLVRVQETNLVHGTVETYTTHYVYDRLNNLIQMTDAAGHVKTMQYDGLSRRVQMHDPNRGSMTYHYDDNGNLLRTEDAKGQVVHRTYDAANRMLREWWVDGSGNRVDNGIFYYDGNLSPDHPDAQNTLGRVAYIQDLAGSVYFSYDPRGNLQGQIRHFAAQDLTFVTRMAYDAMDRLTGLTYPDGTVVAYEYNQRGLLERIPGFVEDVNYTASGQRHDAAYANGVRTDYSYDSRLRLSHLQTANGQTSLQDLTYAFDDASNIVSIGDGRAGVTAANDQTQTFGHDSLYRLTGAGGTYGQIDYVYDSIGNMVSKTSTATDPRLNLGAIVYGENGAGPHALTSAGGLTYAYDANGNLVGKGDATYTWDPLDRLTSVADGDTTSTYVYDSGGQRTQQTVQQGGVVTTTLYAGRYSELRGDELVHYVFDDQQRVARRTTPFDPANLLSGFGDDAPAPDPAAAENQWYTADHLGGTSLLLNDSGQMVSEVAYYPFGLTRYELTGDQVRYGFTGKELDANGLYYYGARFYDPMMGRFLSVDPFHSNFDQQRPQRPRMFNTYAYANNNPLVYIDPDGRQPSEPFPNLKKYNPTAYKLAHKSLQAWNKVTWFGPTYFRLRNAANAATVTAEGISVSAESSQDLAGLVGNALVDQGQGYFKDKLFGAKWMARFNALTTLLQIRKDIQRERLANVADHSLDDERFKYKLNFMIGVLATTLAKKANADPTPIKIYLHKQYSDFETAMKTYGTFVDMEERMAPDYRWRPPEKKWHKH